LSAAATCWLLEVGAGGGYFLDEARKRGFRPHGLELNPVQARFVRSGLGIPCEESPLGEGVFGGKKFDVLYHCDVISHFHDPISELRKMRGVMKDGSFLVFETGFLGEEKYLRQFGTFQYPDHLFFFSEESLRLLLERTGFRLVRLYRYSILPQKRILRMLSFLRAAAAKRPRASARAEAEHPRGPRPREADAQGRPGRRKGPGAAARAVLASAYRRFRHALRYGIGRIAPKKGRPQTVIVVAVRTGARQSI
jgi:hypothetical protein